MVMPCSRSARSPSDSAARSATPSSSVTASRWSSGRLSVSCISRPISVLLPSSTEPAVAIRSSCRVISRCLSAHQKYPSRLRSSIAATDVRSSARVSPRSDTVAAEISAMTPAMSVACERTAPVMVRSPTVR